MVCRSVDKAKFCHTSLSWHKAWEGQCDDVSPVVLFTSPAALMPCALLFCRCTVMCRDPCAAQGSSRRGGALLHETGRGGAQEGLRKRCQGFHQAHPGAGTCLFVRYLHCLVFVGLPRSSCNVVSGSAVVDCDCRVCVLDCVLCRRWPRRRRWTWRGRIARTTTTKLLPWVRLRAAIDCCAMCW